MVNEAGLYDIVQLNDLVQETRRKFTYNKTHRETLKKTMDEVKVKIAKALKDSKDNGKDQGGTKEKKGATPQAGKDTKK